MSKADKNLCIAVERCKSCGLCVASCPKEVLQIGTQLNAQGYAYVEQKNAENCIKCNICRIVCPDVAIGVV